MTARWQGGKVKTLQRCNFATDEVNDTYSAKKFDKITDTQVH